MATIDVIQPDWEAPAAIKAFSTTRGGGASRGPWSSLNLAARVGDDPNAVVRNRALLTQQLGLPDVPQWLDQVHGIEVRCPQVPLARADACVENRPGRVCAVLTADCLPVLLCNRAGTRVAAAHAGWRGLAAGVLESTVAALGEPPAELLAWLGPAIGPRAFEVGAEVRQAFVAEDPASAHCFSACGGDHWLADLYGLARRRLDRLGISAISGGAWCTFGDAERFFSHRRDGLSGRMATLIWLQHETDESPQ